MPGDGFAGRVDDKFGTGFFSYTISKDLISKIEPLLRRRGAQGYEFNYQARLTVPLPRHAALNG
jgi:hypothetical protein